jgi:hypothetical protein
MEFLAALVLVGLFGGICWSLLRPPAQFVIRVSRGTVHFKGSFPRARRTEVEEFLKREFAAHGRITISAVKVSKQGLRFVVRGKIAEGDRQRIRNFFQTMI